MRFAGRAQWTESGSRGNGLAKHRVSILHYSGACFPMTTPDSWMLWLKDEAWPLVVVALCVGLAFLVLKVSADRRRKTLAREREGVTDETFAAHLEPYGFDPVISAATYRYLRDVQRVQFPILPNDALDEDLGLDSDDIKQTIQDLTAALGREFNPGLLHKPLVTVEDLVRLLQASPRQRQSSAA
jgi:acyl carrier protein